MTEKLEFYNSEMSKLRRQITDTKTKLIYNIKRGNMNRYNIYLHDLMYFKIQLFKLLKGKKLSNSLKDNVDNIIRGF